MSDGFEVWRGGVNAWECDEMGHMNVRFYFSRFQEGLGGVAAALGMPNAFAPGASATLAVREQHVRFLREARAGAPLHMSAALLSFGEDEAEVVQVLRHSFDDQPCATAVSRVAHVTAVEARPFPWSPRTRQAAAGLMGETPDFARPRGVQSGPVEPQASLARAEALGLQPIARGLLQASDCDVFGRMRPDAVIGRFSDGAPRLFGDLIRAESERPGAPRIGRAMLEIRLLYLREARAGSNLLVRSGLAGADDKLERVVHWLLDPISGEALATAEAVIAALDLDARRMLTPSPQLRAMQQARLVPGLTL